MSQPCIFIVDDDNAVRDSLGMVIESAGLPYQAFESAEHFLQTYCPGTPGCLLLDVNLPGMSGFELQAELNRCNSLLPIIFISAQVNIPTAVRSINTKAVDFLTKPVSTKLLMARIRTLLQHEAEK